MAWILDQNTPIYIQIMEEVIKRIITGIYPPGSQIPSVRLLALEAGVNPNTMQKALSQLEEEGLLCSHGTVGRFVTTDVEVLAVAREKMCREAVREWMLEAKTLGIGKEELIQYIMEEGKEA